MASTLTNWNGPSALSAHVRAVLTGSATAATRLAAYADGWTYAEIERAVEDARFRYLVEDVDAMIEIAFSAC